MNGEGKENNAEPECEGTEPLPRRSHLISRETYHDVPPWLAATAYHSPGGEDQVRG